MINSVKFNTIPQAKPAFKGKEVRDPMIADTQLYRLRGFMDKQHRYNQALLDKMNFKDTPGKELQRKLDDMDSYIYGSETLWG